MSRMRSPPAIHGRKEQRFDEFSSSCRCLGPEDGNEPMWIGGEAVSQNVMSQKFGCRILVLLVRKWRSGIYAYYVFWPYPSNISVTTLELDSRTAELAHARSNTHLWQRIAHRGLPAN